MLSDVNRCYLKILYIYQNSNSLDLFLKVDSLVVSFHYCYCPSLCSISVKLFLITHAFALNFKRNKFNRNLCPALFVFPKYILPIWEGDVNHKQEKKKKGQNKTEEETKKRGMWVRRKGSRKHICLMASTVWMWQGKMFHMFVLSVQILLTSAQFRLIAFIWWHKLYSLYYKQVQRTLQCQSVLNLVSR